MTGRRQLMVVTLLLCTAWACGKDGKGSGQAASRPSNESTTRPENRASAIHDVPVPAVAGLDPAMSASNREVYRLPRSESLSSLAAFYARTMPVGMPFKGLEWCVGKTVPLPGALSLERVWRAPGTNDFLVLQLTNDQTGPLVTITDERNSPARTCPSSPSK